jgi:hypothetical protein
MRRHRPPLEQQSQQQHQPVSPQTHCRCGRSNGKKGTHSTREGDSHSVAAAPRHWKREVTETKEPTTLFLQADAPSFSFTQSIHWRRKNSQSEFDALVRWQDCSSTVRADDWVLPLRLRSRSHPSSDSASFVPNGPLRRRRRPSCPSCPLHRGRMSPHQSSRSASAPARRCASNQGFVREVRVRSDGPQRCRGRLCHPSRGRQSSQFASGLKIARTSQQRHVFFR